MGKWKRITGPERSELWRRWRAGEGLSDISRALGRQRSAVAHCVQIAGGFAPVERRRSVRVLSFSEREEISRGLSQGLALRRIAEQLGRSPATISREVRRHGGASAYRAEVADRRAWTRARRPKRCRLAEHPRLRDAVADGLVRRMSPQQIAAWLARTYEDDPGMRVSHETIYRTLFIQARGALKKQLMEHLRSARRLRRPRGATRGKGQGQIPDAISIRERPAEVEDRAVPGHWEGDLLMGNSQSQIATLVERHTRYVMLVKLPSKDTATVVRALARHMRTLPAHLRRSLTWDRGLELAGHREFTIATNMQVYFCDPRSPWQRGSNENTNGLLRQYFPKGADLSRHSQRHLNAVAVQMNQRPRETLGWDTPAERLNSSVASTG